MRRTRYPLIVSLLVGQVTACYTWHPSGSPRDLIAKQPHLVRVTTRDNDVIVLKDPAVAGDSLRGQAAGGAAGVPWAEVRSMEYRTLDAGKLVLVGLGGVVLWTFVLCGCVREGS